MRTFLAIACLALVTVTFAGCAEDPERYPNGVSQTSTSRSQTSTGSSSSTGTGSSTGTSTGPAGDGTGNGTDEPPTADLIASAVNGTAPLNVTFRLSGADPEGGNVTWTLVFGDGNQTNGTSLPATEPYSFTSVGNHSVVFTVDDGNLTSNETIVIKVEPGIAVEPDLHCHVTPTQTVGPFYTSDYGGGNWVFMEDNGIAGLQVANNHASGEEAETLGEYHADWVDCVDGDQMVF